VIKIKKKIKILWLSDSPLTCTGFATISKNILNKLPKDKYECHFIGHNYYGQTLIPGTTFEDGTKIDFYVHGTGKQPYSADIIEGLIRELKPDIFGVLLDTFMLMQSGYMNKDLGPAKTIMYYPSDGGSGLPLGCENILKKFHVNVAMARFGQRQVRDVHGMETLCIPHAIDTKVYHPLSLDEKELLKQKYGLLGKFVVGTVARNQGRKMLDRTIKSFARFSKDKDDVMLFCHSVTGNSPIIIREDGEINVIPIEDLTKFYNNNYELINLKNIEVWGNNKFTPIKAISRHTHKGKIIRTLTKEGIVDTTPNHSLLDTNLKKVDAEKTIIGDELATINYPNLNEEINFEPSLAWGLGLFAAEGTAGKYKMQDNTYNWQWKISMKDENSLLKAKKIFEKNYSLKFKIYKRKKGMFDLLPSSERALSPLFIKWFYTKNREKKIPSFIFSTNKKAKEEFFNGYYVGDGCNNKYKSFTSKSKTLMQGLILLYKNLYPNKKLTLFSEERTGKHISASYYKCTISNSEKIINNIIKKKVDMRSNNTYVYDVHTEDGVFANGVGNILVHNTDPDDIAQVFNLKELVNRYKLNNKVVFSGMKYFKGFHYLDMNKVYNVMDVFFLSTSGEGFGVPTIEAMGCEIPCVVTDYTTTHELLVEDGKCGLPVKLSGVSSAPYGEQATINQYEYDKLLDNGTITGSWNVERGIMDVEDGAKQLQLLYDDKDLRKNLGMIGRQKVLKIYDWDVVMSEWDKVFSEMVK